MEQCPSLEALQALLSAQLGDTEVPVLSLHLETCISCQQKLDGLNAEVASGQWRRLRERDSGAELRVDFARRLERALTHPSTVSLVTLAQEQGGTPQPLQAPPPGYEFLEMVGRGGMGVVYRARHQKLKRVVALKMLVTDRGLDARHRDRFRAEAEILARLQHPNIVQIYEVGEHQGRPFLALEFVEGPSLADQLKGAPQAPRAAAELVETLAHAVHHAHAHGIVHRDLKPGNVLLQGPGVRDQESSTEPRVPADSCRLIPDSWTPKITDFGLAKRLDEAGETLSGQVLGTPSYMAPEQARGQSDAICPATDVFALGAILYQLLTGRPPFQGITSVETVMQVLHQDPVSPRRLQPRLPLDLNTICLKCLEKDPRKRYASAAQLAFDLRRFLDGKSIDARPIGPLGQGGKWMRRHPGLAGLLLGAILALLGGTVVSSYFALQANDRAYQLGLEKVEASKAREAAQEAQKASDRQSANLLLDRSLDLAQHGQIAEALHWMFASLRVAPDPEMQRLVRVHLATWGNRVPTLMHWLETPPKFLAVSPDGRLLLMAGPAETEATDGARRVNLQLRDMASLRTLDPTVATPDASIDHPVFSPDSSTILAGNGSAQEYQYQPGWVRRWDVASRKLVGSALPLPSLVDMVRWSPDGRRFAAGANHRGIQIYDATTGSASGPFISLNAHVRDAAFSPDSHCLLLATDIGAQLVTLPNGLPRSLRLTNPSGEHEEALLSAAFAADGKAVLVGGGIEGQRGFAVWQRFDPDAGNLAGKPIRIPTPSPKLAVLDDGRMISGDSRQMSAEGADAAAFEDGVKIWHAARNLSRPIEELRLPAGQMQDRLEMVNAVFSTDRTRVWTAGGAGKTAYAWDLANGRPVGSPLPDVPTWGASRLVESPDGRRVATVLDGSFAPGITDLVQVWDAATWQPLAPPLAHPNKVLSMAFSPDGRYLACGGHFHSVFVWDVASGRLVGAPLPQGEMILDVAFAPDGQSLAVGTWAHEARVWDLATRRLRFPAVRHPGVVIRTRFSPDGRKLLTICPTSAYLWDAHSGSKLAAMPSKPVPQEMHSHVRGLFGPDGRTVLLSSGFGSFRLWDADTGQPLGPPTPLRAAQQAYFDFSPNGKMVVAAYADGTSQLWDVATMQPMGAPMEQPLPIIGVAFQPTGESYWTVADDGTVRSWPLPRPQEGDLETIRLALELMTGRRFDDAGSVVALSERAWNENAERWREEKGSAGWSLGWPAADVAWHEARAFDAEETGAPFTARWHLDRLIAAHPGDWLMYARRARIYAAEGRWPLADADYERAREHGAQESLCDWFEHEAAVSEGKGQDFTALWYLDRALAERPRNALLHERRADLLAAMGKSSERWAELQKAIESGSGIVLLCRLACEKATQGRWQEAVEYFDRARRHGPLPSPNSQLHALACLKANDLPGYRALCADLLREVSQAVPERYLSTPEVLEILILGPAAVQDYAIPLALAKNMAGAVGRALPGADGPPANPQTARERHGRLGMLGAVLYRAGRYQQARDRLQEAVTVHGEGGEFVDWAMLCMVNSRLGNKAEAQRWLQKMPAKPKDAGTGLSLDAIAHDVLRKEAEALLRPPQ